MFYLSQIYSKEEGLVTVHQDATGAKLTFTRHSTNTSITFKLDASASVVQSQTIYEFLTVIKYIRYRDIAVIPLPRHFLITDRDYIYGDTVEELYIGHGYLYSHHNQLIYISNQFRDRFLAGLSKTPIKVEGALIKSYRKNTFLYVVEDNDGIQYHVPYWIIENHITRDNPLLHFPPFRLELDLDVSELEFEQLENTPIQVAFKTKSIGTSFYIYVRDEHNTLYSTYVSYAILKNMSLYHKGAKLIKGLKELSPHGSYLHYIMNILKRLGVVYD